MITLHLALVSIFGVRLTDQCTSRIIDKNI